MTTTVTTSLLFPGIESVETIFDSVRQIESYPHIMPDVRRVRILSKGTDTSSSAWDVEIDGCPLSWIQRDRFDAAAGTYCFEAVEGDFEVFRGKWQINESLEGMLVSFTVDYEVGIPIIEDIIGPILKVKLHRNSLSMLESLKMEVIDLHLPVRQERLCVAR
jgi:ribosome-associated toxin RatA of RatAB toxin-antitoxin module